MCYNLIVKNKENPSCYTKKEKSLICFDKNFNFKGVIFTMAAKKKPMSENARKVLAFLKDNGVGVKFTTKQVQEALNLEKAGMVTGSVTGLVNKEYAERFTEVVEDENGKTKEIKYFALTEAGMNFDPDAVAEEEE